MTAPRRIVAGATYLVTRRTTQRQFLLKPSDLTNGTVGYILGVAAARFGIRLHAFVVLSNHLHLVLTDPRARLPRFCQYFDALVARAMNAGLGRWEAFWSSGSYSAVTPIDASDVVEKSVYTLANPVEAGLVPKGAEWPGLWSGTESMGGTWRSFERPRHFFRKKGYMPERVIVELTPPPGFTAEGFRSLVATDLAAKEAEKARALEAQKRKFVGARRVLAQRHTDSPAPGDPRRGLNPRVAARDKWKRIEALGRLRSFLQEYRAALARLRAGATGVVFPHGTYQLRVFLGVECAAAA